MSDPVTRQEQLLSAISTGGDIISPITREEMYLAYLAGDTSVVLLEPITRKEQFLYQACLNGGGGGGGTEITDGIVVKARDADGNATEIDYYNSTGAIPKLEFGNSRTNGVGTWSASFITKINLKDNAYTIGAQAFYGCANLTTIDFSKFTEFPNASSSNSGWGAQFYGCNGLTVIDAPNLTGGLGLFAFYDCKGITTVNMPKINALHGYGSAGRGCFGGCTAMVAASFGSIGHPVEAINIAAFGGCTQTGLTITIYTTGAYADTAVANTRNGATNATIIIKDSTTGETIVTSTP